MPVLTSPLPSASSSEKPKAHYVAKTYLASYNHEKQQQMERDEVEWSFLQESALESFQELQLTPNHWIGSSHA